MGKEERSFKKGERAAMLSAAVLFAFSILKGVVSLLSGSVALLADSIHSFSDIFSSIAVWAGLRLAQKKPTERFPYGYYKAETFALLIVAVTIVASGALILNEAVDKLFSHSIVSFPLLVLAIAALSGIVSYFLGRYKKNVGDSLGSQSLISEGQHSMVDVHISILVFAGVLFSTLGYPIAEVLAGVAIGLYVIKIGLWFGKDAVLVLMDASLSPQRSKEMKEIAQSVKGVTGVHGIRLRKSGPVSFGEMHIEIPEDLPLDKAHAISDEVEEKIKQRFKDIESITIHMGPGHKEKIKVAIPATNNAGLKSMTSIHFGNVPFFAFVEIEGGELTNVYVKVNYAANLPKKKGVSAAKFLINEKVDVLLSENVGESPFHVLNDSFVHIYHLPEHASIEEAIQFLTLNKLKKMTTPTETHEEDSR